MNTSWIAELRRKQNLTQLALAEKLDLEILAASDAPLKGRRKKGKSVPYLQKRISELEAGYGTPTLREINALSRIFDVPSERIQGYVRNPGGHAAAALFDRLLESPTKSLMIACYSGTPRIPADPDAVENARASLRKNLSFALCIPYPSVSISGPGGLALTAYYQRVRARVFETYDLLCKGLPDEVRLANIAVYEPRFRAGQELTVPLPPYFSRYALVAQEVPSAPANLQMALYLWVETAETRSMQVIGGMEDPAAQMQIEDWRAYFREIVDYWEDNKRLPVKEDLQRWAIVSEAKTR